MHILINICFSYYYFQINVTSNIDRISVLAVKYAYFLADQKPIPKSSNECNTDDITTKADVLFTTGTQTSQDEIEQAISTTTQQTTTSWTKIDGNFTDWKMISIILVALLILILCIWSANRICRRRKLNVKKPIEISLPRLEIKTDQNGKRIIIAVHM